MPRRFLTSHNLRRALASLATAATALVVTAALSGAAAASSYRPAARGQASGSAISATASSGAAGSQMALFRAAAREFRVPVSLLLAVGYMESSWDQHGTMPSVDGGYGVMDLTARTVPVYDGAGKTDTTPRQVVNLDETHYTLDQAESLLHVPAATLQASDAENIRGGAAVLADYARGLDGGTLPTTLGRWYAAVAEYSGDTHEQTAELFANEVFSTLSTGASLVTTDGQAMRLAPTRGVRPDRSMVALLHLIPPPRTSPPVDCPADLNCQFIPAAYAEVNPPGNDPANYGNYDPADRPRDMKINAIVIHDTEESYAQTIADFQDPAHYAATNYVIQSMTGDITEMVRPQDVAWGVGDWYYNMHSISIEHEGFAAQGSRWYTQVMYQASATLVRWLAQRYGVPLDRQHIVGHDNVAALDDKHLTTQHWDPGPFWNWNYYMSLLHGTSQQAEQASAGSAQPDGRRVVTIDPNWATNKPPVTDCSSGTCVQLRRQSANFVYLYTQPSSSAPLLSDPLLHPDGSAGTTNIDDWGDKATAGQKYVVAGQRGNWTGIWYAGTVGWFYNPPGDGQTARYTSSLVITPNGDSSVPVYGAAFPEESAYPPGVPPKANNPLIYTILPGQAYVTTGTVPDDFYYSPTINFSDPQVITGETVYYEIILNQRLFYVKGADVTVKYLS